MVQMSKPETLLTEDERALLKELDAFAGVHSATAFVKKTAHGWVWEFLPPGKTYTLHPPLPLETESAAATDFSRYVARLRELAAAEAGREYLVTPDPNAPAVTIADPPTFDAQLLSAAIKRSGLSVRRFAKRIFREPRTVWRWLAGENGLPRSVREECERILGKGPLGDWHAFDYHGKLVQVSVPPKRASNSGDAGIGPDFWIIERDGHSESTGVPFSIGEDVAVVEAKVRAWLDHGEAAPSAVR